MNYMSESIVNITWTRDIVIEEVSGEVSIDVSVPSIEVVVQPIEHNVDITTLAVGLTNTYTTSEIDSKLEEIEHKRTIFNTSDGQTSFDMWQEVWRIDSVTRNWISLDPGIFSINSPYITYDKTKNWNKDIEQWETLIFNFF